jgi:hypothetical protein
MEAPVKDRAEIGSNDLADSEIKFNTGSATSTTSLVAPPRSGLARRLYRKPTNTREKMGSVIDAIFENMIPHCLSAKLERIAVSCI